METELLICACSSNEHQVIIRKDEEDRMLFLSVHLAKKSFFKRLWLALRYVCGHTSRHGAWEEVILEGEKHAEQLRKCADFLSE